tara:strand:- start:202 stop:2781 length:2580 start_codon:yes stop_codon:yes gene_type:complete
MPQEKIIIEFKSKGSPELIKALNNLAKAQKNVEKGLDNTKAKFTALNPKMLQLSASLKAQGLSWKNLGISTKIATKALMGNKTAIALIDARMKTFNATSATTITNTGLLATSHNRLGAQNKLLARSFATLRSQLLLISFGAMLIERAFVSLVKAYGRQEAANVKLAAGLANVADTVPGVTQRLIDYSAALQKVTAFGDEMITTGMVQFTTFGLNEKAMKSLTPQVLNVARAIQTTSGTMPDLNSLFIAFGKATTTGIGTLTRYGVVLTKTERAQLESMDANESAVKIAEILERQYGGLSEAYAKTTAGMLESAEAARGDAAEALGEVLAPMVLSMSNALKVMFEAMSPERITRFFTAVGIGALSFGLLSGNIWKAVKAIKAFQIAQIKTGWGALAAGIGLASFAIMEYFDVLDDGIDVQEDYEKKLKDLTVTKIIFSAQVYAVIAAMNAEKEAFSILVDEQDISKMSQEELLEKIKETAQWQKVNADRSKEYGAELASLNEWVQLNKETQASWSKEIGGNQKNIDKIVAATNRKIDATMKEWGITKESIKTNEIHAKMIQNVVDTGNTYLEQNRKMITDKQRQVEIDQLSIDSGERGIVTTNKNIEANKAEAAIIAETIRQLREKAGIQNLMAKFEPPKTFEEQAESIIDENEINALLLTEEEKQRIRDHYNDLQIKQDKQIVATKIKIWGKGMSALGDIIGVNSKNAKLAANIQALASFVDAFAMAQKASMQAAKNPTTIGFPGYPSVVYGLTLAKGLAQAAATKAAADKMETGGLIGGKRHSQGGTMINAEAGEFVMSRNAVNSVGLENLNQMNEGGGSASNITLNISAPLVDDTVVDSIIPAIREAIRRGEDIGVG